MKLQLKLNTTVNPQTKDQLHHCLTLSLEENSGKKEIVIENQEDDTKAPNSFYFLTNEEIDAIIDFLTISKVKIERHEKHKQ